MDVHARMRSQPAKIRLGRTAIPAPRNEFAHGWSKTLNVDFELRVVCVETANEFFDAVGQAIGHHFKMQKQTVATASDKEF